MCIFVVLEQEMDGSAVKYGLGTSPGPQWLQEIVPVLGQRLKVHNDLRTLCMQDQDLELASSGRMQVHVYKGCEVLKFWLVIIPWCMHTLLTLCL